MGISPLLKGYFLVGSFVFFVTVQREGRRRVEAQLYPLNR
jgi:hypothetical protein